MADSSDDEPIAKRKRPSPTAIAQQTARYEQIIRHRAEQGQVELHQVTSNPKGSTDQALPPSEPTPTPPPPMDDVFYNFPATPANQHHEQDAHHQKKEQIATNQFIDGLRRAVQKHISNLPSPTPPLPHYAYNNTTKELSRLHGYPHYHQTQPNSKLDSSATHIEDHLEYHVCLFEHKCIREERHKLTTSGPSYLCFAFGSGTMETWYAWGTMVFGVVCRTSVMLPFHPCSVFWYYGTMVPCGCILTVTDTSF